MLSGIAKVGHKLGYKGIIAVGKICFEIIFKARRCMNYLRLLKSLPYIFLNKGMFKRLGCIAQG